MSKLFLSLCMVFSLVAIQANAQKSKEESFPILFKDNLIQWKTYETAKNVKLNGQVLTFEISGTHYTSKAFPGVYLTKTKMADNKDSIIDSKILLFPCDVPMEGAKVIAVQVAYYYKKASTILDGYGLIPLVIYDDLAAARKVYAGKK